MITKEEVLKLHYLSIEKYGGSQFTIDISTGKIKVDEIVAWLKINTQSL